MKTITTRNITLASFTALMLMLPNCNCDEDCEGNDASFLKALNGGATTELSTNQVHLYTENFCQMVVDLSLEGDQWIYFCLDNSVAQSYSLNPISSGSSVTVKLDGYAQNLPGSDGSIDIESVNMDEGTVNGTFDFMVFDAATGDQLHFSNGVFKREQDCD